MRHFTFVLFYESQILIQITTILDFGKTLITQRCEAKTRLLKI